jgi:predicted negative regulator of RcsB-dependent stress response
MAERLQKDFAGTPYAVDGALKMAQAAFDNGKLDEARTRLEWAEQHAQDAAVRSLVRLRLARVLWQQAKPDEALQKLDDADAAYAPLYAELRGDILLAKGDRSGARSAYADAVQTLAADSPARDGLQHKLDDLADAAVKS